MKKHLVSRLTAGLMAVLVNSAITPATAGDIEEGRSIVSQWCSGCHLSAGSKEANDVGPPFRQMAEDPDYTDERLRNWLHNPHPPMPNFDLERRRIEDIIAYIRSLKS